MKVLAICGSPRKGNTEAMLKRVLDGAKDAGASIELVLLRSLNIQECDGCNSCEKTHSCHLMDDMQALYGKLFAADAIIFGSPTHFNNVSSMMKKFIDRMNPVWDDDRLKGKKAAVVCVGGQPLQSIKKCENALKEFIKICSMKFSGSVIAQAETPGEILKNEEVMQRCFELGKKLAEGG